MRGRPPGALGLVLALGVSGCAEVIRWPTHSGATDAQVGLTEHLRPPAHPSRPMAISTRPPVATAEIQGPVPVEVLVHRALMENRTVQAAYHNVLSLRHRIPQVKALDDPILSNTIFPIPGVAPQYSLMGYNPYNVTLAQQFPWFGTLRLRGEAAERDVQVALAELAAAQLDAVAGVKRAYYGLYAGLKIQRILEENRKILEDFRDIARERLSSGGTQQDVIRAGTLITELDRSLAENIQGIAAARASLGRQLHIRPDSPIETVAELDLRVAPVEFDALQKLAFQARPELSGRLAAVARDQKAVELAEKRFFPNVTLGLTYMDMEKHNAMTPKSAGGMPNVGLFVAMNLPVYREKYRAGVCEAQQRMIADARLYEAQCDEVAGEIQDLIVQVKTQQRILTLLRDGTLPRARESFDLARSDYGKGNVDYATVQSALREVLQVQLQITQSEAELGKALAGLERAVGTIVTAQTPVARESTPESSPPPPDDAPGPFRPLSEVETSGEPGI